ncbi:MAG: hypothetical protein WAT66_03920 [Actinomycetota bacterium]
MSDHEGEAPRAEERIDLSGLGRLSDRPPPPKGENAIRVARAISVLLLAIAAAGLPWYFVARGGGGKDDKAAAPTSSPTTSRPSPSPTPTRSSYEVYNVEQCANFRAEPSTTAKKIGRVCLLKGIRLTSDGQTRDADGRLWRHVYDSVPKLWGWMADEYLKPVG